MAAGNLLKLVISLIVAFGAGFIGSLYAMPLLPTYFASLNKPDYIPPDSLFLPIGFLIYLILGLALYSIWNGEANEKDIRICLYLYSFGLVLNVLWIYSFFGLRSPYIALVIMILLLGLLISTIYQAFRVSIPACLLLVPYLIICIIVALSNYAILAMNPGLPLLVM